MRPWIVGNRTCFLPFGVFQNPTAPYPIWPSEMARDYPNTTFEATDIADVFRKNDVPENITFTIANTLKGLPFPDDHFDYIFQRCMLMSFSVREWNIAINELMRVLKPGGFLELGKFLSLLVGNFIRKLIYP
ncbi:hypothetical protein BC936DRAFT_136586 [Jimgerdemannia flammicorona]|uniref:Methyltransferase type 11 domain-containing protein n=1 Tax=Jimgerdemannia flammicorona TaxID=994334 RepID=A0A433CZ96_9FUNG|nr:hypothetical protein BC936DRAFT_136586 [Jimgerdemannia flammicorona]